LLSLVVVSFIELNSAQVNETACYLRMPLSINLTINLQDTMIEGIRNLIVAAVLMRVGKFRQACR
jgi:hypothetical protein